MEGKWKSKHQLPLRMHPTQIKIVINWVHWWTFSCAISTGLFTVVQMKWPENGLQGSGDSVKDDSPEHIKRLTQCDSREGVKDIVSVCNGTQCRDSWDNCIQCKSGGKVVAYHISSSMFTCLSLFRKLRQHFLALHRLHVWLAQESLCPSSLCQINIATIQQQMTVMPYQQCYKLDFSL